MGERKPQAETFWKEEYDKQFLNPYVAAARGYVNEVIRPEETRERLLHALRALRGFLSNNC